MNANDTAALKRQLRSHFSIFLVLVAVIGLNVAVSFLPLERSIRLIVHLGLALVSGGLVLMFFMHLLTERFSTIAILGCTGVLFAALMGLLLFAGHDHPEMTQPWSVSPPAITNPGPSHVP